MADIRFVGVPRDVLAAGIAEGAEWRHVGERMLAAVKAATPVGNSENRTGDRAPGTLRDSLEARFIGGGDPRILIGTKSQGDVLGYLTDGTEAHFVAPVNAKALRWTNGGTVFFSSGHEVSGIQPNDFLLRACRGVSHDQAMSVA